MLPPGDLALAPPQSSPGTTAVGRHIMRAAGLGRYVVLAAVLDLTTLFEVIPKILKLGPHKRSLLVYDEAWTAM